MYHLVTGFYNTFTQLSEYNVVIIGLSNAGKSTFLEAVKRKFIKGYKGMDFKYILPTIGLNLGEIYVGDKVRLNMLDLGGQKEIRHLWDKYFDEAHGIIYVVDSSDPTHFEESFDVFKRTIKNDRVSGLPLLIVVNKTDHADCVKIKQTVSEYENPLLIGSRDCLTVATSSLSAENIVDAVNWLGKAIMRRFLICSSKTTVI